MALALLYYSCYKEGLDDRAWKGLDWDISNSLYEKKKIFDPKNKNKSIRFTKEGFKIAKKLFSQNLNN